MNSLVLRTMGAILAVMGLVPVFLNLYDIVFEGSESYHLLLADGMMGVGGLLILFYKPYPFREDTTEYQYYLDSLNTMFFTIGLSILMYYFIGITVGPIDEDAGFTYVMGIVPIMLVLGIHTKSCHKTMITYAISSALMLIISLSLIYDAWGQMDTVLLWTSMAIFNILLLFISLKLRDEIAYHVEDRDRSSDGSLFSDTRESISTILLVVLYVVLLYVSLRYAIGDLIDYLGSFALEFISNDWGAWATDVLDSAPYFCIVGALIGLYYGYRNVGGLYGTWSLAVMVSFSLKLMLLVCVIPIYIAMMLTSGPFLVISVILVYLLRHKIYCAMMRVMGYDMCEQ